MGKPAARVGDMHVCPMFDGPKPHVGGPVLPPGAPTVLIGGMPAAGMGGMCTCASAPDSIILGSTGVIIGGKPAARLGDMTVHGGSIVVGLPTVLIGEFSPSFPFAIVLLPNGNLQVGNNLIISGNLEFQQQVIQDLTIMANFPKGLETLQNLDVGNNSVQIKSGTPNGTLPDNMADATSGTGTGSTITYDPTPKPTAADPSINRPGDVALHHELVHADHASGGTVDLSPDPSNPNNPHMEESNTISRDNEYRTERGIPTRADHTVL